MAQNTPLGGPELAHGLPCGRRQTLLAVTPASTQKASTNAAISLQAARQSGARSEVFPGAVSRLRGARREKLGREGQPRTMVFHRCLRAQVDALLVWRRSAPVQSGTQNGFEQPDTVRAISRGRKGCRYAPLLRCNLDFVRADVSLPAFRGYISRARADCFRPEAARQQCADVCCLR